MATNNADLSIRVRTTDHASKPLKGIESSIIRFVGAISAAVAAVNIAVFPVAKVAEFDRALRDVQKTTGFTDDEIKKLSVSFVKFSTEIGASAAELANIAAIGGQLGLGNVEAIEAFTQSVARAKITLGLAEEEAAKLGATILNIFNIDSSNIENVFSSINELSNNSVANASDLGDVIKRIGNVASLAFPEVAALAAYIQELGVPREQAGTAIVKFFSNMLAESDKFAKAMEISQTSWINMVNRDAVAAFKAVAAQVSKMQPGIKELTTKKLFGSGRLYSAANKVISDASNDFSKLNNFIDMSNQAFLSGTSSIEEYENVLKAFTEQLSIVGNDLSALAINMGQEFLPTLISIAKEMREAFTSDRAVDFIKKLGKSINETVKDVVAFAKAISDVAPSFENIIQAIKLFIGFKLGKFILRSVVSLAAMSQQLGATAVSWTAATTAAKKYALTAAGISTVAPVAQAPRQQAGGGSDVAARRDELAVIQARQRVARESRKVTNEQTVAIRKKLSSNKELLAINSKIKANRVSELNTMKSEANLLKTKVARERQLAFISSERSKARKDYDRQYSAIRRSNTSLTRQLNIVSRSSAAVGKQTLQFRALTAATNLQTSALVRAQAAAAGMLGMVGKIGKGIAGFVGAMVGGWVGLATTIVSVALFSFWGEIAAFLGFTDSEIEKRRVEQEARERKIRSKLDKLREDYENTVKSMANLEDISKAQPVDVGELIFSSSDDARESVKKIFDEFTSLSKAVDVYSTNIEVTNAAYEVQLSKVIRIKKELTTTTRSIDATQAGGSRKARRDEGETLDKLITKESDLRYELSLANKMLEQRSSALQSVEEHYDSAYAKQQAFAGPALSNLFTVNTKAYAEIKNQISEVVTSAAEAKKKLSEVSSKLVIEPDNIDLQESSIRLQKEVTTLVGQDGKGGELGKLTKALSDIKKGFSLGDVKIGKFIDTQEKDALRDIVGMLGKVNDLAEVNKLDKAYLKNSKAITGTYLVLKKLKEGIDKSASAARAFQDTARGVFDNTAKEVEALSNRVLKLRGSLDSAISDRKMSIDVEIKTSKIDTDLEKRKRGIAELYDKRAEGASPARKKIIESLKRESLLREENFAKAKKAKVEEESLKKVMKDTSSKATELYSKAFEALDEGNARQAAIYKKQAKGMLDEYEDAFGKLVKLETVEPFTGKVKLALDAKERKKFENIFERMVREASDNIPQINKEVKNLADDGMAEVKEKSERVAAHMQKWKNAAEGLVSQHPALNNLLDDMQGRTSAIADDLERAAASLSSMTSDKGGGKKSDEDIQAEIESKGAAVGDLIGNQIGDAISNGLDNSIAGSAPPAYVERMLSSMAALQSSLNKSKQERDVKADVPTDPRQGRQGVGTLPEERTRVTPILEKEGAFTDIKKYADQNPINLTTEVNPEQVKQEISTLSKVETKASLIYEKDGVFTDIQQYADQNPVDIKTDLSAEQMQQNLDSMDLTATVKVNLVTDGADGLKGSLPAQKNARGGYISGPGTGTSDSILSWLSNGEHVIDAFTTRFYGSSFFSQLQELARSGRGMGIKLPAYAMGGPVLQTSAPAPLSNIVQRMSNRTPVNINLGSKQFSLEGKSAEVDSLTMHIRREALKAGSRR